MPSDHTGAWPRPPHWQQYLSASSNWAYRGLKQENGTKTILDYIIINSIPPHDIPFTIQVTTLWRGFEMSITNTAFLGTQGFSCQSPAHHPFTQPPTTFCVKLCPMLLCEAWSCSIVTVAVVAFLFKTTWNKYDSLTSGHGPGVSVGICLKQILFSCHHITWHNQILPLPKPHMVVSMISGSYVRRSTQQNYLGN